MDNTEMKEIAKTYDPKRVEDRHYQTWLERGYFNADPNNKKEPYSIVIPPPNVTAPLHMGHAFNNTIQDILIRFRRKQGYEALWLPGTDHAGIATQNVVEKQLRKENLTRHDLGREAFVERVWEWKKKYGNTIIRQLKKMGCSCDWRRERFTMEDEYSTIVREVFIRLFNKGWIYRGEYIINWCPRCTTALSDEEVEHKSLEGNLWYIKYPLKDSTDFLVVATTRPETMLGDSAVAVHPDDERYQQFIGKTILLPLLNREIPVIADPQVDPEFGTGAVKVTPAHDPNDFLIGQRHNLQQINIMDEHAALNSNAGPFAGLDRFEAREKVVEALKEQGLLLKIEKHIHNVGHCHRCHTVVEPYLSRQWFVRMKDLARPAIDVVKKGQIKLHPEERWIKTYINWLENVRDWCISRQLWWGHRIPVYYCNDCGETLAAHKAPQKCSKCGSSNISQDEDVLDTWFSSWLWPFATLGWPNETEDLKYFYPTSTLVTGPDIIFFWVARMIMAGMEFAGDIPFRDVYLNGIVRDAHGKKMSKSAGNGIDPLEIIGEYSADAMRFTLIFLGSEGQDINLARSHFEMGRNFSNKIWNAYRFLAMNLDTPTDNFGDYQSNFELSDQWILSRLNRTVEAVTIRLNGFRINDSLKSIYHFFWDEFCGWYLELVKPRLYSEDNPAARTTAQAVATHVLKTSMNLLHPYIPFITEEIWLQLKNSNEESIVVSPWPKPDVSLLNDQAEKEMNFIQNVISAIRTIRSEMNVPPGKTAGLLYRTADKNSEKLLKDFAEYIRRLARVDELRPVKIEQDLKSTASAVVDKTEIFLPLAELIDLDAERQRLEKEVDRLTKQLGGLQKKLGNRNFLEKAPAHVVQQEKEKMKNFEEKLNKINLNLKRLK
ncbi:MAG: valine--tRNA ligase [Calditrichia bacterium]